MLSKTVHFLMEQKSRRVKWLCSVPGSWGESKSRVVPSSVFIHTSDCGRIALNFVQRDSLKILSLHHLSSLLFRFNHLPQFRTWCHLRPDHEFVWDKIWPCLVWWHNSPKFTQFIEMKYVLAYLLENFEIKLEQVWTRDSPLFKYFLGPRNCHIPVLIDPPSQR